MTIRHMKIFVAVCQEKNITLAAQKLYISQPAVSNAIKELEQYYGVPLFDRISKKLFLTDAGQTLYDYALHINSLFEELNKTIMNSAVSGTLKIGASITIGTHFMPDYIKSFSLKYPDVKTFLTIDSSDIIEKKVINNDLDIALIEGAIHSDQITSKDFIDDELVVICDNNHPLLKQNSIQISQLGTQNFLMRERNSGTREQAEAILLLHNITINPIWESSSTEAIIQGVSKGLGISILPLQLVNDAIERKQIKRLEIDGLQFHRKYHIIYHKNKYLTPSASAFIKLCSSM